MTIAPASSGPPEQRRVQTSSAFAVGAAAGVGTGATNVVLPSPLPMHVRVVTGRLVVFAPPLQRAVETEAVADTAARVASPAVWWRIDAGGRLWRSNDSGVTWRPILDPTIGIVAASAPTGTVCWVLAHGGVVLRSADGVTFQAATTPAGAASPVAIEALSAMAAVLIAGDGRGWSTVDGGMTWAPLP